MKDSFDPVLIPLLRDAPEPISAYELTRAEDARDLIKDLWEYLDMPLPDDSDKRKTFPIARGVLDYFPDALSAIAELSYVGSQKHNPNEPMQWNRDKSGDEADALIRHFLERGTTDTDGIRHSVKVAWRALAMLQKELETVHDLPMSRGSTLPSALDSPRKPKS